MGSANSPADISDVLESMGAAGQRLNELDAIEAGAGNLSCAVNWDADLALFGSVTEIDLPATVPHLAGYTVLVTGSGCRLRDVAVDPLANVGAVVVHEGGRAATLHYWKDGNFARPTSEFNSHLAVLDDQIAARGVPFISLIHAQPPHLVMLTHDDAYQSSESFSRAILRWEPESIVQLPEGVCFLPFMVPGSDELMDNNVRGLRSRVMTIWAKHGLMVRSDVSPLAACDKVDYAETGARYEFSNSLSGGRGRGLSDEEIRRVVDAFDLQTSLY